MRKGSTKKVATYGMLVALAFIFSYLETLIPLNATLPGIKLGLANIVVLIALYMLGVKSAFILSVVRVVLTSITFGNLSMFWFSFAGAMLSFAVMALLKRVKGFSMVGVSIAGGVGHNVGQIIVAMIVLGRSMIYYLLVLVIGGTITGTAIGIAGAVILKKLKPALQ